MRANLNVAKKEVTIYFEMLEGSRASCFYCKHPGAPSRSIQINRMLVSGAEVERAEALYKRAAGKLRHLVHSGRPVCERLQCEDAWHRDLMETDEAAIDLYAA